MDRSSTKGDVKRPYSVILCDGFTGELQNKINILQGDGYKLVGHVVPYMMTTEPQFGKPGGTVARYMFMATMVRKDSK
jgi:hypothetical protein